MVYSVTVRIAVLMTCFNRKDLTLRCLSVLEQAPKDGHLIDYFLVDGGSTDGTQKAILENFAQVHLISREDFYWNEGMRLAWLESEQNVQHDAFLWMNDDVIPNLNIFTILIKESETFGSKTLIVGSTVDVETQEITYGGLIRDSRLSRLRFKLVGYGRHQCDTLNGNCVFIPRSCYEITGPNSSRFRHSMGDIDFGLRAKKLGLLIVQAESAVGVCALNQLWSESNRKLTFRNWRTILFSPKGVPIKEWFSFCRIHGGIIWPINFVQRYLKMVLT